MARPRKRLGDLLVGTGQLRPLELESALEFQRRGGGRLGSILVTLGYLDEASVVRCLSDQVRVPGVALEETTSTEQALRAMPLDVMERYLAFPVAVSREQLVVAMADPTDLQALHEMEFRLGVSVRPVVATEASIRAAIARRGQRTRPDAPSPPQEDLAAALLDRLLEGLRTKGSVDRADLNRELRRLASPAGRPA